MGLLKSLLNGFRKEPEIYCPSCVKCRIYSAKWEKFRDFRKYCRAPDYEILASSCRYIPTEQGGCATFWAFTGFRSFFIDHIRDGVHPAPGSVVICDLGLPLLPGVEHSGIADDSGLIIHRDGDGYVGRVLPSTFISRLNGLNGALTIYVACKGIQAIGNYEALERAEKALYDVEHNTGYDLFKKNCHQFVQYCYTGKTDNDFTFSSLENYLCQYHDMDNWRRWDINPFEDN